MRTCRHRRGPLGGGADSRRDRLELAPERPAFRLLEQLEVRSRLHLQQHFMNFIFYGLCVPCRDSPLLNDFQFLIDLVDAQLDCSAPVALL